MLLLFLLGEAITDLAFASPLSKRAGGPIAQPIPPNCTVADPLSGSNDSSSLDSDSGVKPSDNFTATHLLYQAYFESSGSDTELWRQCIEQCYGYGDRHQCKSALLAHDAPTPAGWYGTGGGDLETACIFYAGYLTQSEFVAAPDGQYTNATAGNIKCPG